ncbi:MAG: hypothetical protein QM682_02795 [Paracoccus sp. (in: a-proteobacteria)]|uniref:hypothetical protein n=1 Tax=Paracoccus sp. TaxID=267 RepID=UPI0039E5D7AC
MDQNDIGWWGTVLVSASAAGAWLGGETGKIMIAGGLGGMTRWLTSERKRLRDGAIAAVGGCVTGLYLWPLGLHLPRVFGIEAFPETSGNIAMSAYVLGTMGTSAVKMITAYIEQRAAKLSGGDHEQG